MKQSIEKTPSFKKRYIFFKSLAENGFSKTANYAENKFSNISQMFNKNIDDSNNDTYISYMKEYVNFIQQLAQNERNSELAYLNKQINVLKKNPNFLKSDIGQKINKIADGETFNYLQMINLLNSLRSDSDSFFKSIETSKKRMEEIEKHFAENPEIFLQAKELETKNYGAYRRLISKEIEAQWKGIENNTTISEQYNTEIQKIFKSAFKNDNIINKIEKMIDINTNIIELIQNLVVDYVFNKTEETKNFEEWIDIDKISQAMQESYYKIFTVKSEEDSESFEEYALTHNEGLAAKLRQFDENIRMEILNTYEPDQNGPAHIAYKQLLENTEKPEHNLLGNLTKELNKIFNKEKQKRLNKLHPNQEIDIKNLTQNQINEILTTFKTIHTKTSISNAISTTSSGPSSIAELIASPNFLNQLKESFKSYIPGQKINLKNDIVFTCNFDPPKLKLTSKSSQLKNMTENFMENFMERYHKEGSGQTNPEAAKKVYEEAINQLGRKYKQAIKQAEKDAKQIQAITKLLEDTFFGGVSVKEYRYVSNSLGFHGGSLGGSGKVINAVPNILKMYEFGGITPIDAEIIIDALLNCSNDMIGGQFNYVENIKEYLIGGAAMLMFDEGFANTKPFLDKIKENFGNATPTTVHLYLLNGAYIPASYILQNIYENLSEIVSDIIQEEERMTSSKVKSRLEVINNVSQNDFPEENQNATYLPNWNKYSQYAQDTVTIHFLFMAGILDIFEQLPNAFNV